MNKDIIYIDVEDDITAIIGKIKASKDKIIALVPPKRVGILQSAVNLRLLNRMAQTNNKRLVLITGNQALVALAANIGIPVAKTLQSKPELPEISALDVDEGEDVIDGASLPVGDHVKMAESKDEEAVENAIDSIDIDDRSVSTAKPKEGNKQSKNYSGVKVPNFSAFRRKLFIWITLGLAVIGFSVWAAVFAPAARIVITARTSPAVVSATVTLGGNADTNVAKGTIKTVTQQIKKEVSVDFDVTGKDEVGEKAKGQVVFSNCDTSTQVTIIAGTYLSLGGRNYVLDSDTVVSAGTFSGGSCTVAGSSSVASITAKEIGSSYNVSPGSNFLVSGFTSNMTAETADGLAGGTSKEVKVPSKSDVQTATGKLAQLSEDDAKAELIAKFTNGEIPIEESFTIDSATPVSTPKVGEEAKDGTAKLVSTTTYTITAIAKADIQLYLSSELDKQLATKTNQRVYDDGIDSVALTEYNKKKDTATVKIITTAKIGPSIDEAAVKEKVKGKIYGDAQAILESIDGISNVDVKFSYFWVQTVPNDDSKVSVEFKLEDGQ